MILYKDTPQLPYYIDSGHWNSPTLLIILTRRATHDNWDIETRTVKLNYMNKSIELEAGKNVKENKRKMNLIGWCCYKHAFDLITKVER